MQDMATRRWSELFPEMEVGDNLMVYYIIDPSLNSYRRRIEQAMDEIASHSRFRFEPRENERCYLMLTKKDGCWFENDDDCNCRSRISIGINCEDYRTILHELLHAIGFPHEHNRPDRDDHIIINWSNIEDKAKEQFEKVEEGKYPFMDFDIDYKSIMIYNSNQGSINDEMTIQRKDGGLIKENVELSDMDIEKLRLC